MNRAGLLIGVVVLSAAWAPVAAFQVPQSREEFVKAVADGKGATTVDTLSVDRSLNEVYGLLKQKASTCLDVTVKRSGFVGGQMEVSSSDYNPTVRLVGGNRVEFALQVVHRPRAIGENAPPGGLYVMAADIRPTGPRRSEVVLYRPTIGYKKVTNSVKRWVNGENADCPKLR